ncbi:MULTISPECIES: trigger factor [unclassified Paenibacillus]|uniref:trigger factor n=1 Tax=unclassified Paenibacillus TaxID=185978 RepID=UPI0009547004|nr:MULTISPECIES: trigger factor [unclassified Paenibacillus]ASS66356.1 trigger factor [Paenibacillus sp. RUD330]SIQ06854.1 trigger factor [Paenibacillus sp. RU4X]SIQ26935.1 trigger factor [Paenibacillus sp. RU4T]
MAATWEKIETNVVSIDVEVGAEQVKDALDQAFKKVVGRVNVPGFRKGKVPRGMFESRFGVESLYQDAIDILLPTAYADALKETGVEPVDRPEIDIEQFAKGESFKFKAKVTVKPEVKLGDYKGVEVAAADAEVTEEELSAELDRLQQRHAELVVVEEGASENGDVTVIDFEGFVDGEAFEGGQAERYTLELGSNSFIPGFEEQVVGMATGDFKDVEVTFPEEYHAENLAGKPAVFKVKLHEIKRKNLPALDDEFAKDVSEFDTLEEFKQDLSSKLKERKQQESEQARENALVDKVAEAAEVEIPEAMINSEVDFLLRDFENRIRQQGLNMDLYYQFSGQDEAALREQMRADAQKRVLNNLVLDAIAKQENIEISEEEVGEELENLSKSYNRPAAELREIFERNGNLDNMKEDLKLRKTIKFLLDNSKVATEVA